MAFSTEGDLPEACVVISHWTGHGRRGLYRLLRRMSRLDAGIEYDLTIVSNGGGLVYEDLPRVSTGTRVRIVNRANQGYNIGAWDAGFQAFPDYNYYLFLQDECLPVRRGWLELFLFRFKNDPGVGLLGESMMWEGLGWEYIKISTARDLGVDWYVPEPINPIDMYRQKLVDMGVPEGEVGSHLQTLVLFTSGALLHQVDGFPSGDQYHQAVACEIAISRKMVALGHRIGVLRPGKPFSVISHPQWTGMGRYAIGIRRLKKGLARRLGLSISASK